MMMLISGPNGSGKSRYAEQLAETYCLPRYYIATMVSQNAENEARIEKHRLQRAGLDFHTIEEPWRVGAAPVEENALVLLEDVSNLLANLIFVEGGDREQALCEILRLADRCRHLLIVTISGLDAAQYEGETARYIADLQWLNARLLSLADAAVEMENGQPVVRKGNIHDLS